MGVLQSRQGKSITQRELSFSSPQRMGSKKSPPTGMGSDRQLISSIISPSHCGHMAMATPPSLCDVAPASSHWAVTPRLDLPTPSNVTPACCNGGYGNHFSRGGDRQHERRPRLARRERPLLVLRRRLHQGA